jgi:branched-chain amino acid transport system permease protein
MLIAFALGIVTLRLKGLYFAIATLAFTLVMQTVVTQLDGITNGTAGITLPVFFGQNDYAIFYFFVFFAGIVIFLSEYIQRSKYNYSFTAIRSNEEVAKVVGIDVVKDKVLIFTVSSGIVALLGMFYAYTSNFIDPGSTFDLEIGVMGLAIAVLGGLYTTIGPLIGAIILVILQEILSNIVDTGYMLVYGLVIILVILYVPKGVVGLWKKIKTE